MPFPNTFAEGTARGAGFETTDTRTVYSHLFLPTSNNYNAYAVSAVSGTTVTVASTGNISAGMNVFTSTATSVCRNVTTVASVVSATTFTVSSATGITTSVTLYVGYGNIPFNGTGGYSTTYSWVSPVTATATILCIGGGGGSGSGGTPFASSNYGNGGSSSFSNGTYTLTANGGKTGANPTGGAGGAISTSGTLGTVTYSGYAGGAGGTGSAARQAGGGGCAGYNAAGGTGGANNASGTTGAAGGGGGGGAGGNTNNETYFGGGGGGTGIYGGWGTSGTSTARALSASWSGTIGTGLPITTGMYLTFTPQTDAGGTTYYYYSIQQVTSYNSATGALSCTLVSYSGPATTYTTWYVTPSQNNGQVANPCSAHTVGAASYNTYGGFGGSTWGNTGTAGGGLINYYNFLSGTFAGFTSTNTPQAYLYCNGGFPGGGLGGNGANATPDAGTGSGGGGGGALLYANNISLVQGNTYTITVGYGGINNNPSYNNQSFTPPIGWWPQGGNGVVRICWASGAAYPYTGIAGALNPYLGGYQEVVHTNGV